VNVAATAVRESLIICSASADAVTRPSGGEMVDRAVGVEADRWAVGDRLCGDGCCAECGYGVTVYRSPLRCPMCAGSAWRETPGALRRRTAHEDAERQW